MTKNMTSGNPAKLIFFFALPLIIGNIFQQFYSMADTMIVGRTIGVTALAAVGCTGSLSFFIIGFVNGFTSGLAVITAQRFGAKRYGRSQEKFCHRHPAYHLPVYRNDDPGSVDRQTGTGASPDTGRNSG